MILKNDFKDKVAIVTGSAMGIGKAIAEKLYHNGAIVVISDVQVERGEETAALLGERAIFVLSDISDQEQVNSLVKTTVEHFGKLDIMVNNAGVNSTRLEDRVTIDKYPDQTWHKIINIDLNGTFYCCKAAAKVMIEQRSGSIINIASVAGIVALRLQIGFVAAKAAILKMTEAMSCELAACGIRVNAVSPGSIVTDATRKLFYSEEGSFNNMAERVVSFIPQGRPGEANEVADAVAFLASDSGFLY
ncbi:MAG: SDR family NAD(P)-dependent oxidoreductase [Segetibacter sp.]